jgi:hypothetical protein
LTIWDCGTDSVSESAISVGRRGSKKYFIIIWVLETVPGNLFMQLVFLCNVTDSHSSVAEDSVLLGSYAAGNYLPSDTT